MTLKQRERKKRNAKYFLSRNWCGGGDTRPTAFRLTIVGTIKSSAERQTNIIFARTTHRVGHPVTPRITRLTHIPLTPRTSTVDMH